nr:ribonuclease H-like domain-containing protein [Tanacetum cinerariifolium]
MNEFCEEKGIKREYSVARTPQQNEVAERRNKTLIEAARTMLADSKLPITFWAKAVNTACYVQNRTIWESLMENQMNGSLLATLQLVKLLEYTTLELGRLVPSCFAIFDLEPLSLSFDFVFSSEIFKSLSTVLIVFATLRSCVLSNMLILCIILKAC